MASSKIAGSTPSKDDESMGERVLAFVYDLTEWRDMSPDERRQWQKRVRYVLSDESNDAFGEWLQKTLAPLLGVSKSRLSERLSWSEGLSGGIPDSTPGFARSATKSAADARRAFRHPDMDIETKREILREAMQSDPDLAVAVQADASQVNRQPSAPSRTEKVKNLGFWASELLHIKEVRARLDSDRPSEEAAGQLAEGWIGLAEAVSSLTLDEQLQSLIEGSR